MNKFYKLDENTRRTIFKQVAVQSGIPPVAVEKELVGAFSETLSQWDGCLAAKTDTVYYWNSFPHWRKSSYLCHCGGETCASAYLAIFLMING